MSVLPIKIGLVGTRGDDVYFTFKNFTIDGKAYDVGTTAALFLKQTDMPANTFTLVGTFNKPTEVVFKFTKTDNTVIATFDYDIAVTFPNTDIFTHVIGQLKISADVSNP